MNSPARVLPPESRPAVAEVAAARTGVIIASRAGVAGHCPDIGEGESVWIGAQAETLVLNRLADAVGKTLVAGQ
jgi:hypothetical protein